ncbi:acetyl/propionyl/methylcrotonyl-CoA carboxylase subunit alpha [Nocardia sp. CA-135953]|uniref:acetyl/propionyl/methylcrotonyl-CoA carboxylase subunit alpha n=1 Tax=Nocardia sp. CA-135953 TaxID=3239978 RepID=UPI003D96FB50
MRRILIANRGEIVSRVARTVRAHGIRTVGIYSEPDAHLPYLHDVDEAVALAGTTPAQTYLNIEAVLAAARRADCDAIHPGYGFLAENPDFAHAVEAAGLCFIGPPADCVAAMGSKVRAKEIARKAAVPVLPDAVLAPELTAAEVAELASEVGYPLLVKASAGGGGRGIRLVTDESELEHAVTAAGREAVSAFGDGTLFLERYLPAPRHIEIQVMADKHGTVLHIGDRECSVQRRHQKLLEEAPAALVDSGLRAEMAAAAVRLATEIGYLGAGTCEFLVDGEDFYFLEMNTRLQVEHTVTEQVSGLDLVALQLRIADGGELGVRQQDIVVRGHSIQARVCAENPAAGWLPSSGPVLRYDHPVEPGLRFEDGIATGCTVSPHYDSMIVKVIGTGADRAEAIGRLSAGLRDTRLHGPQTNIPALLRILDSDDYRTGSVSVNWLEARPELAQPVDSLPVGAVAAAVYDLLEGDAPVVTGLTPAWSNTPTPAIVLKLVDSLGGNHEIAYLPPVYAAGPLETFEFDGAVHRVRRVPASGEFADSWTRVEIDGMAADFEVTAEPSARTDSGGRVWVDGRRGVVEFTVAPRFADVSLEGVLGGPTAPMPGTVLDVRVQAGEVVSEGQPLVVVEAMKMEHVVAAPGDFLVERVLVGVGESVAAGQVLVELKADE